MGHRSRCSSLSTPSVHLHIRSSSNSWTWEHLMELCGDKGRPNLWFLFITLQEACNLALNRRAIFGERLFYALHLYILLIFVNHPGETLVNGWPRNNSNKYHKKSPDRSSQMSCLVERHTGITNKPNRVKECKMQMTLFLFCLVWDV